MSTNSASTEFQPRIAGPTGPRAAVSVDGLHTSTITSVAAFAITTLLSALGLLIVACGFTLARTATAGNEAIFWCGMGVIFLPAALRLLSASASDGERIGTVVVLGLSLYLVKVLHSPLLLTYADEFLHWRSVNDLMQTGHLFAHNPLLPISPFYPGLEIVTGALVDVTGMSIFAAAILVMGLARLMLMLGLFLVYERVSRSAHLAGIGVLLYTVNPSYLFFDAQFAYESLALPFVVLVLFCALRRQQAARGLRIALSASLILAVGMVVVTHHISAFMLILFLSGWAVVSLVVGRFDRLRSYASRMRPDGMAMLVIVATLGWSAYVATLTIGYLAPNVFGGIRELFLLITGELTGRTLFQASSGEVAPLWERIVGFGSIILLVIVLLIGLWQIWRHYRHHSMVLMLALAGLAYPASLVLRFTRLGGELAVRASGFLFFGVAFVLALAIVKVWLSRPGHLRILMPVLLWTSIIFVGGVIGGWARWARLPGPYLVTADTRSIEREGLAAAAWTKETLGPENRILVDRINRLLMGTYGEQRPVTSYGDHLRTSDVFLSTQLGAKESKLLRRGDIRYVVADRRLTTALPQTGVYFERGELGAFTQKQPLDPALLDKFDRSDMVNRLFDSGDIVVYDVGALAREP